MNEEPEAGRRGFNPSVTVVLPCLDEAGSLPGVLAKIPDGYTVLVVDNGSTDATADVARAHGATVVVEPVRGYGSAVHAGVMAATTEVVAVLDGDGSMDPGELPTMVAMLEGADLVVARRRAVSATSWHWHARLGNKVLATRLRRALGLAVHDIGPVRVCRRRDLIDLGVSDRRSGYPVELLVKAGRAGWRVVEHDITYYKRTAGKSKVSGSVSGTVAFVVDLAKAVRR